MVKFFAKKKNKDPTFSRYMYVDETTGVELPMFVVGYEELYDSARENVVAIRCWKFVFDGSLTPDSQRKPRVECDGHQLDLKKQKKAEVQRCLWGGAFKVHGYVKWPTNGLKFFLCSVQ